MAGVLEYKCMAEQETAKGDKDAEKTLKIINGYLKRMKNRIDVTYEEGYDWTVGVRGEKDNRITKLTKKQAMDTARAIKNEEFNGEAEIVAQTLTKEELRERTAYRHYEVQCNGYSTLDYR